jgi:hypothetical protein
MVAAQKFATELADAVIEASGEMDAPEEKSRKRRAPQRAAPVMPDVDPAAAAKAEAALAKLGIRKTG